MRTSCGRHSKGLIGQLRKRQKHHRYMHFYAIFLSLQLDSTANCNPCENHIDIYKLHCQNITAFGYINISHKF